jgi:hypothetical protein
MYDNGMVNMSDKPQIRKGGVSYRNKHTGEKKTFYGAFMYRGFENDWERIEEEV